MKSFINRGYLRFSVFALLLIFAGAAQVVGAFNRMVQPTEPFALLQIAPERGIYREVAVLGQSFAVPVEQIKQEVQETNNAVVDFIKALPWQEGEQLLQKGGRFALQQTTEWWEKAAKTLRERREVQRE